MAFVQTAEWQLADRPRRAVLAMPRVPTHRSVPLALRHVLAILGSALVHFLLLYFFLSKLLGSGEADHAGARSESLLLFDLSDAKASEPERAKPAADQKKEQAREQVSTPRPVPPQEWKIVPLPKGVATRTIAAPPPATASSAMSMTGAASGSAAAGGGGNYDPYAGAAPQRLMPQYGLGSQSTSGAALPPPMSGGDPLELDQDILNRLRSLAKQDGGNDLLLTVEIDVDGRVTKVSLSGGSRSLLKSIRKLLGKSPPYRVTAPLTKVERRQVKLS
jgi:hypothetical protein